MNLNNNTKRLTEKAKSLYYHCQLSPSFTAANESSFPKTEFHLNLTNSSGSDDNDK
jgi:hypothetical protein